MCCTPEARSVEDEVVVMAGYVGQAWRPVVALWIAASMVSVGGAWAGGGVRAAAAAVGVTTRVSVGGAGVQAIGKSVSPAVSADGRYVAFLSGSSNLVAGDTNRVWDVFVRDQWTGTTERVSVSSAEVQGNRHSRESVPAISADGRYVAFTSRATNLVPGDTNGKFDVFVRDRVAGTTRRVSVNSHGTQSNGFSQDPALSRDGRVVVFASTASNLVRGDTNRYIDVFVRNRTTGTTRRVSVNSKEAQGNLASFVPAMSAGGRYVAFGSSSSNLVRGDTNRRTDVFVRDRVAGTTRRVSVSSNGAQGNDLSGENIAMSGNGRYVAFSSMASNLVGADTNRTSDVFVRDRRLGTTRRVSVASDETQANGYSFTPALSGDGRYVAFASASSNLVGTTEMRPYDVFVRDRLTGTTRLVSAGQDGELGNAGSLTPSMSRDGRYLAFESLSSNLVSGDTNDKEDVFVQQLTP